MDLTTEAPSSFRRRVAAARRRTSQDSRGDAYASPEAAEVHDTAVH
jgi:hypothetical protein